MQSSTACITVFYFVLKLFSLDINECESAPCLNDGLCVDGINSYRCKCKENYVGENCETSKYIMFQAMNLSLLKFDVVFFSELLSFTYFRNQRM